MAVRVISSLWMRLMALCTEGSKSCTPIETRVTPADAKARTVSSVRPLGSASTANSVAPGFIVTDMTEATAARMHMSFEDFQAAAAAQIPVGRVGQPDEVANLISFLVSEGTGYISGQVIYIAGGPLN